MKKINFNPNVISKKLLDSLDDRPKRILEERFGLVSLKPRTLESIGQEYGITRERVRQIESFALNKIRKSDEYLRLFEAFNELKDHIDERGSVVQEDDFITSLVKKDQDKNYLFFLLVTGDPFERLKEDSHFKHSWTTDLNKAEIIRDILKNLHSEITHKDILSEKEIVSSFANYLKNHLNETLSENTVLSILRVSKRVAPNALGEWGLSVSPYVRPRGMRDYAFLVMRRHGNPMHFTEVAKAITDAFDRPAHVQTVHNELIKDNARFVLVGRGLYALKEWGYQGGVVKDVIMKILEENGPLSKEDVIKRVLKERYVKENTILVNLQNSKFFKKDKQGCYTLL